MAKTQPPVDDGTPKLLRRTVIKATAAGIGMAAIGSQAASADDHFGAEIVIPAQATHGLEIAIESVTVPEGGFVALVDPINPHEKLWPKIGGMMPTEEEVIESQTVGTTDYLEPGTHEDIVMELDEPLDFEHNADAARDDKLYQFWIHQDSEGNETFQNVAPGEPDNRYPMEDPDRWHNEAYEVVVGDAFFEYEPFNPGTVQRQIEENTGLIEDLTERISANEDQISSLEDADEDMRVDIEELQDENENLRGDLEELQNENEDLQDADDGDGIPGFGIVTGIAGAAVGAAAAAKRFGASEETDDT